LEFDGNLSKNKILNKIGLKKGENSWTCHEKIEISIF
jgi:hypothetical protein